MKFETIFFDGKSSKTHAATIKVNMNSWNISYLDSSGETQISVWKIDQIKKSEVFTKGLVAFTYGNTFPFEKIESTDTNFINYISKSDHKNINNKLDTFLHKSVKKSITFLSIAVIVFSAAMYFYIIPTVAVNFAKNLPKQSVIDFGSSIFKTLSHDLEINENQSEKLQQFVNKLQIESEFPIKAYVVKNDELNAFAVSGGKIIIYSALLEKIESEHQLAALIGHEISHIEERHVLKNVSRNLSGAMFVAILFGDVNAITTIIGENAHLFSQLSFTRSLEKEADIYGLEILKKNHLDLHGMPQLFKLLHENNTVAIPSFLNSHPMLDDRIEYTKTIADKQTNFKENNALKEKWVNLKNAFFSTKNIIPTTNE